MKFLIVVFNQCISISSLANESLKRWWEPASKAFDSPTKIYVNIGSPSFQTKTLNDTIVFSISKLSTATTNINQNDDYNSLIASNTHDTITNQESTLSFKSLCLEPNNYPFSAYSTWESNFQLPFENL